MKLTQIVFLGTLLYGCASTPTPPEQFLVGAVPGARATVCGTTEFKWWISTYVNVVAVDDMLAPPFQKDHWDWFGNRRISPELRDPYCVVVPEGNRKVALLNVDLYYGGAIYYFGECSVTLDANIQYSMTSTWAGDFSSWLRRILIQETGTEDGASVCDLEQIDDDDLFEVIDKLKT